MRGVSVVSVNNKEPVQTQLMKLFLTMDKNNRQLTTCTPEDKAENAIEMNKHLYTGGQDS